MFLAPFPSFSNVYVAHDLCFCFRHKNTMAPKRLTLCGFSGVGKTEFIKNLGNSYDTLFLDYHENSKRCGMLKNKHSDPVVQILYTIYVTNEYRLVQGEKRLIQDRCAISDVLYECVYEHMKDGSGIRKLDQIFEDPFMVDIIKEFNILFLIVPPNAHQKVLDQMILRGNGIDILSLEYLEAQWIIFEHLRKFDLSNFFFHTIPKHELYTEEMISRLAKRIETIFEFLDLQT